jgi:hypothetical protein
MFLPSIQPRQALVLMHAIFFWSPIQASSSSSSSSSSSCTFVSICSPPFFCHLHPFICHRLTAPHPSMPCPYAFDCLLILVLCHIYAVDDRWGCSCHKFPCLFYSFNLNPTNPSFKEPTPLVRCPEFFILF